MDRTINFKPLIFAPMVIGFGYLCYRSVCENILWYLVYKYEKKNNCKLIVIKQEMEENIDFDIALKIQTIFSNLPKGKNVDIILHTLGGCLYSTIMINNIFKTFSGKIRVFVPIYAYSAGTLLSLMANELYANVYSQFSPCDPQSTIHDFGTFSSKDLAKLSSKKDKIKLFTERAKSVNTQLELITQDQNNKVKEMLFSGKIPHDTSLSVNDMKKLDVVVNTPCPDEIIKIFNYATSSIL
jgi:ATP-dependent protease ClpP protease subunit